ncbi:Interferon-induced protein with tetratricopeptide repeats 3, partial [Galemys pyrenaicus]
SSFSFHCRQTKKISGEQSAWALAFENSRDADCHHESQARGVPKGKEGLSAYLELGAGEKREFTGSEDRKSSLDKVLSQLKCHFTWNLFKENGVPDGLESQVLDQISTLNTEIKATMYNLLAYIKHCRGQNEEALECLQQAEEFIQHTHAHQAERRSLVTWGNYAWVYYHLGRLSEAQTYVDKVKQVCEKFSNPYSIECPELEGEEGWTWLKCRENQNERAKVCFEKALEKNPSNPEFSSGLAIAMYRLGAKPQEYFSVDLLKQAIELSPDNQYIKVLLALKLLKMNEEAEGERLVEKALETAPCQTDVLYHAANFYKIKGDLDKAIELYLKALEFMPNNCYLYYQIAGCYRAKVKQVQDTGDSEVSGNREVEELKQYAKDYLNKAIERGLSPLYTFTDLTELLDTEEHSQTASSTHVPNTEKQPLHGNSCNFQENHEQSEDTAVQRDLEGFPTSNTPLGKENMKNQQQKIAESQVPQDAPNYWYRQGLIHKMNGDLLRAAECYEKELGCLLKNSPSGIDSFFLLEEGNSLDQLRCHFTWDLQIEDTEMPDLENRVFDQMDFLDIQCEVEMRNLLAYVKHLEGRDEEALTNLKEAEDLTQQECTNQSHVRSLVTWGNYAWLYYHMGRLADAQTYLDKVENTCKELASSSRYKLECPEMDCQEGWALMKCGGRNYERVKACFEKAVEAAPNNPEASTGYAIIMYRLDNIRKTGDISTHPLKHAISLNPENVYLKALLALKLQETGQEAEGEKYIEEALTNMTSHNYVLRYAAKFYRRKGSLHEAIKLLKIALKATPNSTLLHHQIALCYRSQIFQIKKEATNWRSRGQPRENVEQLAGLVITHLEYAVQVKPTFVLAYIHLAEMYTEIGSRRKAEDIYQKLLCMNSAREELQAIHFNYGKFQEHHRKSEVDAIAHYLKAIKMGKSSFLWNKSITSLRKLALKKLKNNVLDLESLSIVGFSYKSEGDLHMALRYYERALQAAADLGKSGGHGPQAPKS